MRNAKRGKKLLIWGLDRKYCSEYCSQESSDMECLPQAKESLELKATEENKRETVLGYSGICSFVRLRDLDSKQRRWKTAEWVLHPHTEDGSGHKL